MAAILNLVNGWKTYIAGAALMLTGAAQIASAIACKLGASTPGVTCGDLTAGVTLFSTGLGFIGVKHAISKANGG